MEIGKLNRRFTLKTVTRVADGIGGFTETPTTEKTTWGAIMAMSQREQLLYGMEVGMRAYKVILRLDLSHDIDQNYYIEYTDRFSNTKELRVISIIEMDEAGRQVTLLANERSD